MTPWVLTLLATLASPVQPAREPAWIPVGPTGGSVRALAVDSRDPQRLFLGTPNGVLYRSDDGGERWRRMSPGFPRRDCSLDELVVVRGVLYVGFWELNGNGGGVARSSDGGQTFTLLEGIANQQVRALAVSPSDDRVMAAGTPAGVMLSRDAGSHWNRITPTDDPNLKHVESMAFDPVDPSVLYAGTRHLAWKTADGGATWAPIHTGMVEDSHVMTLSVDPDDRQSLYATACTGIYASGDGGTTWTKSEGIPESSRRTRAFERNANVLLAGTTEGLWISEDRGAAWRLATRNDVVVNAIVRLADGAILLGTEEEGVLRSTDLGRTWTGSSDGFTERFVTRLLFDRENGLVLAGTSCGRPNGGAFISKGMRGSWRTLGDGLEGRPVLALASVDRQVFAGTDDGIFVRRTDATVWSRLPMVVDGREVKPRVTHVLALPSKRLIAATPEGLVTSTDEGATWTRVAAETNGAVHSMVVSPSDPRVIVVAARAGFLRSEDGGATWKLAAVPLEVTPHVLDFVPSGDSALLATTTGGLFRSDDLASTWHPVNGGVPHCDLQGLAVHPDGHTVFASDFVRGGVFRSSDGGATWQRVTTRGLVSDRVWMLDIDPGRPDRLLAASPAGGLQALPIEPAAEAPSASVETSGSSAASASTVEAPNH